MGRLIDADDVKKMISDTFEKEKDVINSFWKMGTLMDKVDEIQTAYNVDAVVEQLEEEKNLHKKMITYEQKNGTVTEEFQARRAVEVLERAIEIVKGGGVDAN